MDLATHLGGALIAFAVAVVTTPAGISGAILLIPVQVSILGVPNPALTPTNLLYNVIATPGGIAGYARQPETRWGLARFLVLGAVPGVLLGAFLRVEVLSGPRAFYAVIAAVLLPLGAYLLARPSAPRDEHRRALPKLLVIATAFVVGVIGGVYGIGGGSLLAPLLVAFGYSLAVVAPAALVSTLLTSVAGVAAFVVLSGFYDGEVAPDWSLGIALGLGGLMGGFVGASVQHRIPEGLIRRLLGVISIGLAVRYGFLAG